MEKKNPSQPAGRHPSKERIAQIRKALKAEKAKTAGKEEEIVKSRLEKDHDAKKAALEQSPLFANYDNLSDEDKEQMFKANVIAAEVRKNVSKALYEEDKNLPPEKQREIIERQINRFYDFKVNQPKLRAHVEAPHGTKASDKVEKWSEDHKISDYETNTNEITAETTNWMIFNKPRLVADVNSLPADVESSLRSEGAVYTKEDNINAVKAQRDLTAHLLKEQDNLDGNGKAKNPYLAVYVHGKVDTRGHDFEIAAKQENGKGPLNPLLAFWIAEKLKEKVASKGLKNLKGETPTVNVVTYKGAYSGSPALTRMRHGDGTFDFKGFGENFQALQLEVGAHLRKTQQQALSSILNELMIDFSEEFKTPEDMAKLEKYAEAYGQKLQKEKDELFSPKNLGFSDEVPEGRIALSKALREALEVDKGDTITVNGKELKVMMMKAADMKSGKTMMVNGKHQELREAEKLTIEAANGKTSDNHAKPEEQHPAEHQTAADEHPTAHPEKKQDSQTEELKKGWKYFGKMIWTKIKELLPWNKH